MSAHDLGTADIARLFNVSAEAVRAWVHQGVVPAVRVGRRGRWRFNEAEVAEALRRKCQPSDSSPADGGGP
jgi:excisionase family DNA binding protein